MSSEILSQSEIDALLSAISTGQMDAEELKKEDTGKKIRIYDFKRALRFSKDQIRSLTRIHENFARFLTNYFSAQLRTFVQISVASVDQIPFEEFVRSIPKTTFLNVFSVQPLEGRVLMEVNPNIGYAMLDRVLGGKGDSVDVVDTPTEIETKILSDMFDQGFTTIKEAWANIEDINPQLEDFEVNTQFLQIVSPNETVIVISLATQVGDSSGMINICIPHVVLEPIMPTLSAHYWMQVKTQNKLPEEIEAIESKVKQADIPIVAELGKAQISIQDFLFLEIGDIIDLNTNTSQPLHINVGGLPKFTAQPGKLNKKLAIQILDTVEGGDDENVL